MLSSTDILNALHLRASKTLTRWYQRGLIPPPQVGTHPGGRGRMAYWPDWVLSRCVTIKQLLTQGKRLQDIRNELGPPVPPRKHGRLYNTSEVSALLDRWECERRFGEEVHNSIAPLLIVFRDNSRKIVQQISRTLTVRRFVSRVLQLARSGQEPTMLVDATHVTLVAGDDVAAAVQSQTPRIIIIVPLGTIVRKVFPGEVRHRIA